MLAHDFVIIMKLTLLFDTKGLFLFDYYKKKQNIESHEDEIYVFLLRFVVLYSNIICINMFIMNQNVEIVYFKLSNQRMYTLQDKAFY